MFPPHVRRPLSVAAALLLPLCAGCGRGESAEERQINDLRDELSKVQSDSDRFEKRLGKLEVDSSEARPDASSSTAPPAAARSDSAPMATPQLRVVHLGPDGAEESSPPAETAASLDAADSSDRTPRPQIKLQGSADPAAKGRGGRKFHIEESAPDDTSSPASSAPSALDPNAKRAYDAALALVNAKKYPQALEALAGFLVKYPDNPNADNAMYWRGECYFAQGQYAQAAEQFEGVLARFPMGNKVPDALLKLGLSQQHLGDAQGARQQFDRLRRDFPHADATRRIPAGAPSRSTSGDTP